MDREFVSFPKSGRSWLRYILAQLALDGQVHFHHDGFEFNDGSRPPHNFDARARLRRYARVGRLVYLERDPRDVMVSLYHQVTGRFRDFFGYRGNLAEFLRDAYFGAPTLRRFRDLWAQLVPRLGVLAISYEDCHRDTAETVRRVVDYYGLDVDPARLAEAVANAEFGKMQRVEQAGTFSQPWLRPRNGAPKVREGKVGGFRDALGAEDIAYLNAVFGLPSDGR